MRPISSVSVLMPTWQGMPILERVLHSLATQELDRPWDLHVIDSGSRDGTWECLEAFRARSPVPCALERIDQLEFDHGDTRNLLAARSRGELLVFLTQDAIPSSAHWLARLVANFEDPEVGAAYCRNVPRPDARPLTKIFSDSDPGYAAGRRATRLPPAHEYAALSAEERRRLYNFNDVASALRREWWERHPFPRANFGEDVLMARALLEAGATIVYDDEATVEHSHDYDVDESHARAAIDARFNAEWLDRVCVANERDVQVLMQRTAAADDAAIDALGLAPAEAGALRRRARDLRLATFHGLLAGSQAPLRHPATRARADGRLRVLYVVHGFPPDTWAGTEIYTDNLAREMQRRGHRVAVFTRVPGGAANTRDFELEHVEQDGLSVWRMLHALEHGSLEESYLQPKAEAPFLRVLFEERPDVVHFQHLIHTSASLVHVARAAGAATVVTCHDYWGLCARVQLIRPDGELCPGNMGSGCLPCIKDRNPSQVAPLTQLDRMAGREALEGLARAAAGTRLLGAGVQRKAGEYLHLRARERYVLDAYAAADLRISPSRFLRAKYLESGRFDPHTFLFSDNGMRTDHVAALQKSPARDGRVRFGFVGSLVWYKGGEVLVRALQRLADAPCVLHVHGAFDPEHDEHHAALERLAQAGNVHFLGRFDNARLSEVYAEIDVLVVPSLWYENSPITIHEAFLTRTPVVASDIGGMVEFVREGIDGLRFQRGDDADLARVLRRFVDEPELLATLGRTPPPVKTLAQNGEEMEFRYRALACRDRQAELGPRTLLELGARDAVRAEGAIELQGADMLLLRPGGAAVEYELGALLAGPVQVELDVQLLGGEPDVEHGGRLLVDGDEVARIPLFRANGHDELRALAFEVQLPEEVRRLRIESAVEAGGAEAHLRLAGLRVRTRPAERQLLGDGEGA